MNKILTLLIASSVAASAAKPLQVYILAGQIRFHVGDEQTVLGPGGLLVVPPNTMHWGEVVGDEPVLNLDVFTPQRPEYV